MTLQKETCNCNLCEGKYIQVDPVGCGCTECITGEYRPAVDQQDYDKHNCDIQHISQKGTWQGRWANIAMFYGLSNSMTEAFERFIDSEIDLALSKQREKMKEKYNELLYAVVNKYPDETRHETALRYIREREMIESEFSEARDNIDLTNK